MLAAENPYAAEVAAAKQRIKRLKDRLAFRTKSRRDPRLVADQEQDGAEPDETLPPDVADGAEPTSSAALKQMIARCLLDPGSTIPIDLHRLQQKLVRPETSLQFEEAMRAAGVASIDPVVREMGTGDAPALEVEETDWSKGSRRLIVLAVDRGRLVSMAGFEATPAHPDALGGGGPGPRPPPAPPPMGGIGGPRPVGPPGMFGPPGPGPVFGPGPGIGPGPGPGHGLRPGMGPGPVGPMGPLGPGSLAPGPAGPGPMPSYGGHPSMGSGPGPPGLPGPPGPGFGGPMQRPPGRPMFLPGPGGIMDVPRPMGFPGPPPLGPGPMGPMGPPGMGPRPPGRPPGGPPPSSDLDSLLARPTIRDRAKTEKSEEFLELIAKPTAKESATVKRFKTEGGPAVREYCPHLTKDDCRRARGMVFACARLHFRRLIFPWTNAAIGNCSYLDTCRHMKTCRFVHYELDDAPEAAAPGEHAIAPRPRPQVPAYLAALGEAQWIKCDVRTFDMTVLGKFGVVMADPPWEIHQDLPYGTMADEEMRRLNIGALQDEGVIFLWVTGRAMELGRECLEIWGYKRVDELIWVKTNQLQRLIRTGRTGHWLNHSKEHCLVGVKGAPTINRNLDCDVLVAEVRETSRKPDEMYPLLERLSPGTRKLEIFARVHNCQPGWVGLGNQLPGINIRDADMRARYEERYGPIGDGPPAQQK